MYQVLRVVALHRPDNLCVIVTGQADGYEDSDCNSGAMLNCWRRLLLEQETRLVSAAGFYWVRFYNNYPLIEDRPVCLGSYRGRGVISLSRKDGKTKKAEHRMVLCLCEGLAGVSGSGRQENSSSLPNDTRVYLTTYRLSASLQHPHRV